jgi:hypothetical protein
MGWPEPATTSDGEDAVPEPCEADYGLGGELLGRRGRQQLEEGGSARGRLPWGGLLAALLVASYHPAYRQYG